MSGYAIVAVSLGAETRTAIVKAQSGLQLTSSCTADGALGTCDVALARPAPEGGITAQVESSSKFLKAPSSVTIPEGQMHAEFSVEILASDQEEVALIRLFTREGFAVESIPIRSIRPVSLSCRESQLMSGESTLCEVRLNNAVTMERAELSISTSSSGLKTPVSVIPRRGQSGVLFEVTADEIARPGTADLIVRFGKDAIQQSLLIMPPRSVFLWAPENETVLAGTKLHLPVVSADPIGLPLNVSASNLPDGSWFDATTGSFEWTPSKRQTGSYTITFAGTSTVGATTSRPTSIEVGPDAPVLSELVNSATGQAGSACVPGGMATLLGKWLSGEEGSSAIASSRLRINGADAIVLNISTRSVDFLCPRVQPGTALEIVMETPLGISNGIHTVVQEAAPGVFMRTRSSRSPVLMQFYGRPELVGIPTYFEGAQVALPGDALSLWASGIPCARKDQKLWIRIGAIRVAADAAAEWRGTCKVDFTLPSTLVSGESVPLTLEVMGSDGRIFSSNTAGIAVGSF